MSKLHTTMKEPESVERAQSPQPASAEHLRPDVTPAPPEQSPAKTQEGKGGNAEAARYRVKLRETEAERDVLIGTVEQLRRQLVAEAMPPMSKLSADALWNIGRKAGEFFGAGGQLDVEGLATAVQEAHQALGVHFGPDPVPGAGGGHSGSLVTRHEVSWADAIKRK